MLAGAELTWGSVRDARSFPCRSQQTGSLPESGNASGREAPGRRALAGQRSSYPAQRPPHYWGVGVVSTVGTIPGPGITMVGVVPSCVKMILSVAVSALALAWIARSWT